MLRMKSVPRSVTVKLGIVAAFALTGVVGVSSAAAAQPAGQEVDAMPKATAAWVQVTGASIRPTVPGQTATGGFMQLTARQDLELVGFSTSAAGEAELHEMSMDGDVMRMRSVPSIKLPAGQAVSLQPGGLHLMLMDLKHPLKPGDTVHLTLKLKTPEGRKLTQVITVPVQMRPMMPGHGMGASSAASAASSR